MGLEPPRKNRGSGSQKWCAQLGALRFFLSLEGYSRILVGLRTGSERAKLKSGPTEWGSLRQHEQHRDGPDRNIVCLTK